MPSTYMGTLPVLLLLGGSASLSAPSGRAVRRSAPHAPAPRDPVAVAIKSELEAAFRAFAGHVVEYFADLTVTHTDEAYMARHK